MTLFLLYLPYLLLAVYQLGNAKQHVVISLECFVPKFPPFLIMAYEFYKTLNNYSLIYLISVMENCFPHNDLSWWSTHLGVVWRFSLGRIAVTEELECAQNRVNMIYWVSIRVLCIWLSIVYQSSQNPSIKIGFFDGGFIKISSLSLLLFYYLLSIKLWNMLYNHYLGLHYM